MKTFSTGPVIYACKHHSWGDGFCIYSQFDDLAFVTGDHLEKYPLMSTLLSKLGAIVVNNCGGVEARPQPGRTLGRRGQGRPQHPDLSRRPPQCARTYRRYRSGVWHMMNNSTCLWCR